MTTERPQAMMKDRTVWAQQILEHRRALFERVVIAFPELMTTKRTKVDIWRLKLSTRITPAPPQ